MSDSQRAALGSGELLSLAEDARLTPYTPGYLNVLVRQGKLPAVEIARNWLTTSIVLQDYLKKQAAYHQGMLEKLTAAGKEQV